MRIFLTGINEGCGKTLVGSGIVAVMQSLGYQSAFYKPIQTGAIDNGNCLLSPDLDTIKKLDKNIITHTTFLLTSNSTPLAASEFEFVNLSLEDIEHDYNILNKNAEIIVVEGTGGLLTPLKTNIFNIHIPLMLKIPVVFVVTPSNNSLNIILNELNTAKQAGLDIIGIIINKYPLQTSDREILTFSSVLERCSKTRILGVIKYFRNKPVKTDELFTEILSGIDIQEIFRIKIPKLNPEY